ncbi:6-pyruvoyl trahydropterin synthase family protein [Longibacter sp.]|uniref:6-pyruvoyl trahydropterin synthase family protein n=1 Tax=Longibacter sp. TaxID=2045415 RepID=UPI003EB93522
MYELMVRRDFMAQHYLTVPDAGPENEWHSHHFTIEVELQGEKLNKYGYLVDIDDVKRSLDNIENRYRDATLNDLKEFEGRNPSVEHFARFCCQNVLDHIDGGTIDRVTLRIWEDDDAWASYTTEP